VPNYRWCVEAATYTDIAAHLWRMPCGTRWYARFLARDATGGVREAIMGALRSAENPNDASFAAAVLVEEEQDNG